MNVGNNKYIHHQRAPLGGVSTSTAVVVGLVSAGQINVHKDFPINIGANIGTPVTNTVGAKGRSGNRTMMQRAFAGATVHDELQLLAGLYLLPLEVINRGDSGREEAVVLDHEGPSRCGLSLKDKSQTKIIARPPAHVVVSHSKYSIHTISLGAHTVCSAT